MDGLSLAVCTALELLYPPYHLAEDGRRKKEEQRRKMRKEETWGKRKSRQIEGGWEWWWKSSGLGKSFNIYEIRCEIFYRAIVKIWNQTYIVMLLFKNMVALYLWKKAKNVTFFAHLFFWTAHRHWDRGRSWWGIKYGERRRRINTKKLTKRELKKIIKRVINYSKNNRRLDRNRQ